MGKTYAYRFRIDVKEFTEESEGEVAESTGGKEVEVGRTAWHGR